MRVAKIKCFGILRMNAFEAPNGYRLVRIGVKGRRPTLYKTPIDEMTPRQRKDYKYRLKTREKRLEYERQYYRKKQAEKTRY